MTASVDNPVESQEQAPVLRLNNLTAGYRGARAISEVSLSLPLQGVVGIVGANGAGKSTLLRSIMGMADVMGGSIEYRGKLLRGSTDRRTRSGLVFVPEGHLVVNSLTVRENLALVARNGRSRRSTEHWKLADVEELFPILSARRRQIAGLLSGGEQQMLALARGLLLQPDVLLLDEPSLGVAPVIRDEIYDTLANLKARGATMLVVEQSPILLARVADQIQIMRHGELVDARINHLDDAYLREYFGLNDATNASPED